MNTNLHWRCRATMHPMIRPSQGRSWIDVSDAKVYSGSGCVIGWQHRDGFLAKVGSTPAEHDWYECDSLMLEIWAHLMRPFEATVSSETAREAKEIFSASVAGEIAKRIDFWEDIDTVFNDSTLMIELGGDLLLKKTSR